MGHYKILAVRIAVFSTEWKPCPQYRNIKIAEIQRRIEENTIFPLTYLGQIAMDELPRIGGKTNLPRTGILYFFYDLINYPQGWLHSSKGGWRSIYLDVDCDEIETFNDYEAPEEISPHCSLTFEVGYFLCEPEYKPVELEQMSDPDFVRVCRELRESFPFLSGADFYKDRHKLLGFPEPLQDFDMARTCHRVSQGLDAWGYAEGIEEGVNDWQLLAQIDCDEKLDWEFGDMGRLFFWIKQQDLEQQDFSNVWFQFECA
jgi:Domain of unknown function (DUF1963)